MIRNRFFFLMCMAILLSMSLYSSAADSMKQREILVLGDSLSAAYGISLQEGWVNLLRERLQEKRPHWYVRNASISGSTTGNGKQMLEKVLQQKEPDIVIIELGANDGLRGFPLAQVRRNLQELIARSHGVGAQVLLVAMEVPPNYGRTYTEEFRAIYSELSELDGVAPLPFLMATIYDRPELIQEDQLHPTAEAQPEILDVLWPGVDQAIAAME